MPIQSAGGAQALSEDKPSATSRKPCAPAKEVRSAGASASSLLGAHECVPRSTAQNFGVERLFATSIDCSSRKFFFGRRARLKAARCNVSALPGANQG